MAYSFSAYPRRYTGLRDPLAESLRRLHTYGRLSASFRPAEQIVVLRSYLRQRQMPIRLVLLAPSGQCFWAANRGSFGMVG
jgi:hypothetical protein